MLTINQMTNLCVWADCKPTGALVYAYIRNWIHTNEKRKTPSVFRDGRYWTYQSIEDICEGLAGVLCPRTVGSALRALVQAGYLIRAELNDNLCDRTSWYTLGRDPATPSSDPNAKSRKVLTRQANFKTDHEERLERKEKEAKNRLDARIAKLTPQRETFIRDLETADYTGTPANLAYTDQYNRIYQFTALTTEDRRMVVEDYVDWCIRHGNTPNFNHFVTKGIQATLAKRYASQLMPIGRDRNDP